MSYCHTMAGVVIPGDAGPEANSLFPRVAMPSGKPGDGILAINLESPSGRLCAAAGITASASAAVAANNVSSFFIETSLVRAQLYGPVRRASMAEGFPLYGACVPR